MSYIVNNAIIMAAGTSSRFAPLSYERPKALIEVKGEILIERQIRQLLEAGIPEIILVTGYMQEQFQYLKKKYGIKLVHNPDFLTRNNNSSLYAVRSELRNTYICSADNYFTYNPFEKVVEESYYSAIYANGNTKEWCLHEDQNGYIDQVQIGGNNAWFMLGHTFWSEVFSKQFVQILEKEYYLPETANKLWESIYMDHLDTLKMRIRKYPEDFIFEFDTLDELRSFDSSYIYNTRSAILKTVSNLLHCLEKDIVEVTSYKNTDNAAAGIRFRVEHSVYEYEYKTQDLRKISL